MNEAARRMADRYPSDDHADFLSAEVSATDQPSVATAGITSSFHATVLSY